MIVAYRGRLSLGGRRDIIRKNLFKSSITCFVNLILDEKFFKKENIKDVER